MLDVSDLRAGYGRMPILHGVSFRLAAGETVGILGHNGMGKSTLMKSLMGIVMPMAGRIELDGRDIARLPSFERARRGIGYVPQGRLIFPGLTVRENLRMGAAQRSRREQQVIERTLESLPRLKSLLERIGGTLSGGEQQLLAIARTLCTEPRLLLLDEPTEGIQPSIIDLVLETLQNLRDTQGLSMIVVEQNLDFIGELCRRVYLLQKGRIVRELTKEQLGEAELVSEFAGTND